MPIATGTRQRSQSKQARSAARCGSASQSSHRSVRSSALDPAGRSCATSSIRRWIASGGASRPAESSAARISTSVRSTATTRSTSISRATLDAESPPVGRSGSSRFCTVGARGGTVVVMRLVSCDRYFGCGLRTNRIRTNFRLATGDWMLTQQPSIRTIRTLAVVIRPIDRSCGAAIRASSSDALRFEFRGGALAQTATQSCVWRQDETTAPLVAPRADRLAAAACADVLRRGHRFASGARLAPT